VAFAIQYVLWAIGAVQTLRDSRRVRRWTEAPKAVDGDADDFVRFPRAVELGARRDRDVIR
jgi:hypothetical protein